MTDIAVESVEISPARARDELVSLAQALLSRLGRHPTADERLWFIVDTMADGLFVRGESSPLLADVWDLHPNTVERSAASAAQILKDPTKVTEARERVAMRALRRSDETYERSKIANDRDAGALISASNQSLDTYGKVTGAISSTTNVNVTANIEMALGVLMKVDETLRPEAVKVIVGQANAAARLILDGVMRRMKERLPEAEHEAFEDRFLADAKEAFVEANAFKQAAELGPKEATES